MAYVQSPLPQDQQNQLGPTGTTTPNPLAGVPPQTGGSAGTGGGGGAPGVGSPTQFGSSASKLSDYLTANKDQIQGMGNQIAGTLGSGFTQTQGDINAASQGFGNSVNAGYAAPNSDLVKQAAADPTGFAANPSNVTAFQGQLNDTYSGPQNFESTAPYTQVQNEVQNAVQNANLINSPSGLSTYLGNNVEKNATPGENTLDTALLESEPTTNKAITDAVAPYAGLTGYLGNQTTAADALVPQAQAAAQQAQQGVQTAFNGPNGVIPGLQNTLQSQLSSAQTDESGIAKSAANIQNAAISGQGLPTQQDYARFDPTGQYAQDQGILTSLVQNGFPGFSQTELAQYLSPNTNLPLSAPGMANVTTPQQAAEGSALNTLFGNNTFGGVSGQQYTSPSITSLGGFNGSAATNSLINELKAINPGDLNQAQQMQYLAALDALGIAPPPGQQPGPVTAPPPVISLGPPGGGKGI